MQNYNLLIERIAKASNLGKEEIEKKVEEKKAKLSGLISKEGAAQIIAAELGVNFEDQELKISELVPGMRKVNVIGKIIELFPVREFEKNDRKGKVCSFVLADETGNCRIVLWDIAHIALIENGEIGKDTVVEIKNASMRDSEIHLSGFSEIKKSEQILDNVKTEKIVAKKTINEAVAGQEIQFRGIIVSMYPVRFYNVCPECKKKANQENEDFVCKEHGKIQPKKRAILNLVVDDGTENMRMTLFSNQINQLIPEADLEDIAKQEAFKKEILGTEMNVQGRINKNQLFGNLEIVANNIEKVNVDKLIEELEKEN
jgi:replication factor A1